MEMITSKPIPGILCVLIWMSIITRSQGAVIDAKQNGAKGDGVTDDSQVTFERICHYILFYKMISL